MDMKKMYKDSSQNFQNKVQIPADMKGIYTDVAEFNEKYKDYFQRENIEKNRRNQKMNEIARTLYRLDNNQKRKGSSSEQTAIQRFKKKNIKYNDTEIKNIHNTLETYGIEVSDDVKKSIVQKYNNLVSVNAADKKEKEHQQNSDILNEYNNLVDKIYLEYMPLRAKVSDQQVRIVQEINEIIKNTKNQQYQNEFKAIRKRRIDHLTMVLDELKNSDQKQGQSQINQVLDQNLKKAYPKLFANMTEPTVKVEQNLQQQQDKVILTPTDINLIKAGANIPMSRHDNLKHLLLTNSYEKIWRDNFKDSPGVRGVLINLQKTTILKDILNEIKYKLDENYYKKTNFLSKQIDNITQSILSISIPQETQQKDDLYYVYVIIDYANIRYKIDRERIQKTISEYIDDKILEIQRDFGGHNKIYRIDVKQGETFATRSITTSATTSSTNSNRSSDGLEIIVPCKIGGKPAFALNKDDIDFQYKARMNFHANNDTSKNMDTEGPITSSKDVMKKFEAEYEYYKKRIGQIQARLAQLASQKQSSDSSDQNKGTSSNILSLDKTVLQQQKANMTKDWLKKIRANPNDDLMCMIIFCFLSTYSLLNPSLDLPVRTVSDDEYRDYKVGYIDDLKRFM